VKARRPHHRADSHDKFANTAEQHSHTHGLRGALYSLSRSCHIVTIILPMTSRPQRRSVISVICPYAHLGDSALRSRLLCKLSSQHSVDGDCFNTTDTTYCLPSFEFIARDGDSSFQTTNEVLRTSSPLRHLSILPEKFRPHPSLARYYTGTRYFHMCETPVSA
jgi:hypothetical protein